MEGFSDPFYRPTEAQTAKRIHVRMFVFNNCTNDARVLKESSTLVDAGYDVEVVALLDKKTVPQEKRAGVRITRLRLDPINQRVIRAFGNPMKYISRFYSRKPKLGDRKAGNKLLLRIERLANIWRRRLKYKAFSTVDQPYRVGKGSGDILRERVGIIALRRPDLVVQISSLFLLMKGYRAIIYGRRKLKRKRQRVKRNAKHFIRWVSKHVFQDFFRWMLSPMHRYFIYYDFYRKAKAYSSKNPADIYHCHDLNTLLIGIDLKQQQGAHLVYDSHELYLHKNRLKPAGWFKQYLLKRIERRGMREADRVITVGGYIAEWMAKEYGTEVPAVILNAPRQRAVEEVAPGVSLREKLRIPEDQFLLVYSGGITFNRGLENVIKAVKQVDGLRFVMLGYGSEKYVQSLKALIQEEEAGDKISFFGPVPHYQVPSYLASADCGIAPILNICLSYYYCSPNKLFEYVQARLPVLASNFPEMEKVVNENDIGFTFDPEDCASIEAAIRQMMDHPEERKRFAQNTHSAAEKYRWAIEEDKLKHIYLALEH